MHESEAEDFDDTDDEYILNRTDSENSHESENSSSEDSEDGTKAKKSKYTYWILNFSFR